MVVGYLPSSVPREDPSTHGRTDVARERCVGTNSSVEMACAVPASAGPAAWQVVEVTGAGTTLGSSDQPKRVRSPTCASSLWQAAWRLALVEAVGHLGARRCRPVLESLRDVGDVEILRGLSVIRSPGCSCVHERSWPLPVTSGSLSLLYLRAGRSRLWAGRPDQYRSHSGPTAKLGGRGDGCRALPRACSGAFGHSGMSDGGAVHRCLQPCRGAVGEGGVRCGSTG